jgi:ComF family protein
MIAALLDTLWPRRCAACDELSELPFCAACDLELMPAELRRVPGVDRLHCCYRYEGPAERALFRLKYDRDTAVGARLAEVVGAAAALLLPVDVVAPVPLGRARLWWRGQNQAAVLAARIGGRLEHGALHRRGGSAPQVGSGRAARARHVHGQFSADPALVRDRSVLVVDDVVTTGATLGAVAAALHRAGAREIRAITLLEASAASGVHLGL